MLQIAKKNFSASRKSERDRHESTNPQTMKTGIINKRKLIISLAEISIDISELRKVKMTTHHYMTHLALLREKKIEIQTEITKMSEFLILAKEITVILNKT